MIQLLEIRTSGEVYISLFINNGLEALAHPSNIKTFAGIGNQLMFTKLTI